LTPETQNPKTVQGIDNEKWWQWSRNTWLLIAGLMLFNIGCFAATDFPERLIRRLDVRFWPLWYFGVMTVLVIVSIVRFRKRWKIGLFWIGCVLIVGIRCYSDLTNYCDGSLKVVQHGSPVMYDYLIHFPKGYNDFGGKRPLLIFLHGAGEVGKDVTKIAELDACHYATGRIPAAEFPFLVVSPVTPKHGWEPAKVVHLIDELLGDVRFGPRIDPNRIYLTGFSMGGFGTFQTACAFPDRFAAIVPLAGGGKPADASKLQTVPTWAFHGDADTVVSYTSTKHLIDAMETLNHPNVKLTTLHGAGHGIPELVYTMREVYQWLLQQKKKEKH